MKKILCIALIILLAASVPVSAADAETAAITRLDIINGPKKNEYLTGEKLDITDLYLTVTYENGDTQEIKVTEDMLSGYDAQTVGAQIITVSYRGKSASFSVKVVSEHTEATQAPDTFEFDTSPATRSPGDAEGEPNIIIIIAAVTAAAAAAAVCIIAVIKPKKIGEKTK